MNKPKTNQQYEIGNIRIQHYTNGSFAYQQDNENNFAGWRNIPYELGEKLLGLKSKLDTYNRFYKIK